MIKMTRNSINPASPGVFIEVIPSNPSTPSARIYVELPKNDTPGTISWEAATGIPPENIDEIERALQDAWRIAKGYIQVQ